MSGALRYNSAAWAWRELMAKRTAPVRVITADDDPIVRELLRGVLRRVPNIDLVGEAADGAEAVKLAKTLKPDVLLLDLLMPLLPGMDTLRELASEAVPVRTIVLCAFIGKRQIIEALQLGARAILLKKSLNYLTTCIAAVVDGYYWIENRKINSIAEIIRELVATSTVEPDAAHRYKVTRRELQILTLVTLGNTNREIGDALSISEETVKRHLANMFDKLGMSNRLELAMFAVEHQLVSL